MEILQIVIFVFSVLVGYALGVWHTRRAVRDALAQTFGPPPERDDE